LQKEFKNPVKEEQEKKEEEDFDYGENHLNKMYEEKF
jgi:hypothetical protein